MTENFEIAAPDAAGMVASLSSLGYSLEAAIADLVDNSIAAEANQIDVAFTWEGERSWVAIVDDGRGMTRSELVTAMTPAARGPYTERTLKDLGRFGMGLKTASFSQARQLTVASSGEDGHWTVRTWDLDTVETTGEWRLLHGADPETTVLIERLRGQQSHGTIVIWRRLNGYDTNELDDEKTSQQFYDGARRVGQHLGMVFARFLGSLALNLQGEAVQSWDPFLGGHQSVQSTPLEELPLGGNRVTVRGFVLPHAQKLSPAAYDAAGGPNGWLNQQGFYVYRRQRLILAGDWLSLRGMRREEKYNLARISVDIPAELDSEWSVDVRKSKVVPPIALRRHLERIAKRVRDQAAEVLRHRGQITARTHGASHVYMWRVERHDGRIRCKINRNHPLVKEVLRTSESRSPVVTALIVMLEETVPVEALRVMHETDTADDPEPFRDVSKGVENQVAQMIYESLLNQGRTPAQARQSLGEMPPFNQIDGFWHQ
ncbi:ATP-binding protein [Streptosporangium sp. NPDC023825]|uniref:ATP-binding protein n=1 Tax=Streptosporangium sp. NPDC023825 TaxID=3154909 RepID=UPI00342ED66F